MIINLTQHTATPDQIQTGVIDLPEAHRSKMLNLITFDDLPTKEDMTHRAKFLSELVSNFCFENEINDSVSVMIGGAPYFMTHLEKEFKMNKHEVLYAFSKRVSEEQIQEDGTVKKISFFKHVGFVKA
jgi:hypothetical protein